MSDDKPFACRVPGCNQKFTNEDHLEVHRKKHDIHLGFSDFKSLDTPVIADQTPTPTRFLKNLAGVEEALFSDLHPNPFDAEFRKATSKEPGGEGEGGTETPSVDIPTTLTAMATATAVRAPQVTETIVLNPDVKAEEVVVETEEDHPQTVGELRDSPEPEVASQPPRQFQQQQQGPTTVVVVSQPAQPAQTLQIQGLSDQLSMNGIPLNGPIMIKLPSGQTIPVLPPSVTNPQEPIPTAVSANPNKEPDTSNDAKSSHNNSVKMKLKSTLLSNQSQGNMNVMTQAVEVVTKQQEVKLMGKVPISSSMPDVSGIKRQYEDDDDDADVKRQKFLERNRAAASRCRNKRKQWITDLEKRADELASNNTLLSNEVGKLRNEVAQLKELLLAHKDCPVTLQQRAAGLFMRVGDLTGRPEQDQEAPEVIAITTTTLS